MGLKERLDATLRNAVNRGDGLGEPITYTHKDANKTVVVRCFPQSPEELDATKEHLGAEMGFKGLYLEQKPLKNDQIVYMGVVFKVESIRLVLDGCWDVQAFSKVHNMGRL